VERRRVAQHLQGAACVGGAGRARRLVVVVSQCRAPVAAAAGTTGRQAMSICKLSIVVPCYNEQDNLHAPYTRIVAAANDVVGTSFEIVLINDGSARTPR